MIRLFESCVVLDGNPTCIYNAIHAGVFESCVVLDGNPTESGAKYMLQMFESCVVLDGNPTENPGTYKSAPRLTIEGTGDAVLTIGTQILEVTDLAGGVIVDAELCECFDLTETALRNDRVTLMDDRFPVLHPGANIISWTGDGVTKVTVAPRWRDL